MYQYALELRPSVSRCDSWALTKFHHNSIDRENGEEERRKNRFRAYCLAISLRGAFISELSVIYRNGKRRGKGHFISFFLLPCYVLPYMVPGSIDSTDGENFSFDISTVTGLFRWILSHATPKPYLPMPWIFGMVHFWWTSRTNVPLLVAAQA